MAIVIREYDMNNNNNKCDKYSWDTFLGGTLNSNILKRKRKNNDKTKAQLYTREINLVNPYIGK